MQRSSTSSIIISKQHHVISSVTGNDCEFDISVFEISDQGDIEFSVGYVHASSMHSEYVNVNANVRRHSQPEYYLGERT